MTSLALGQVQGWRGGEEFRKHLGQRINKELLGESGEA